MEQDDCKNALYPEQMLKLKDLGADITKASAYWYKDVDKMHLVFKEDTDTININADANGNIKYYLNDKCAIVPAFTLEDILNYPTGKVVIKLEKGRISIDKCDKIGRRIHLNGGTHSNNLYLAYVALEHCLANKLL